MTGVALADVLGVTRQAVSQYEKGHQSPAPNVMRRISEVLRLPLHRFLRPVSEQPVGTIHYRSLKSSAKSFRTRAERRYGWLKEIVTYLRLFVKFPEVRFPDFEVPKNPEELSDPIIEDLASQTRRFWGLGDGPISNTLWLLENNGAIIVRHELFANKLDAFSEWSTGDSTPYIVLGSDKASAVRSRFDLAHELAHVVLHRPVQTRLHENSPLYKEMEAQAHRFAGAFLFPERSFASEFINGSLDSFLALKAKWRVSVQAMIRRASHLGLISEKREKQLWINLTSRGWKTSEPLDDTLEPEQPRFLKRSFDLITESGLVPKHQIPFELAMHSKDIEELIGLSSGYFDESPPVAELRSEKDEIPKNDSKENFILRFPTQQEG